MGTSYIRSTTHALKFAHVGKRSVLDIFLEEYRHAVGHYVSYLWETGMEWMPGRIWDREHDLLDCPNMISTVGIPIETRLSARALKCAATQACAMVSACFTRRRKDLFIQEACRKTGQKLSKRIAERLEHPPTMPGTSKVNAELNSICVSVGEDTGMYELWVNLKSLFNDVRGLEIHIPLKRTKRDNKWINKGGILMPSILLSDDSVFLRYNIPIVEPTGSETVGCDQGVRTCYSFSNRFATKAKKDGHDYAYVCRRIARTRPGSKNNHKALAERKNIIGHATNQIDFSTLKTIKYERHFDTKRGKKVSKYLKAFSNPISRIMLANKAQEFGVRISEVDNVCNSLRCSGCGWVQKANRNKKEFICKACGLYLDADVNAAINVELQGDKLQPVPFAFVTSKLHHIGFFWTQFGFFEREGNELSPGVGSLQSPIVH